VGGSRGKEHGMLVQSMLNLNRTETWCSRPISGLRALLCAALLCTGLTACVKTEEKKDEKKDEPTEADKEVAERLAKKRADREAAEKALVDKAAAIQALAVLPEAMPKNLAAACDAAAQAQDEFMMRNFEGEGLAKWNEAKGTQLGMVKSACVESQSIEIPACQTNAMNNAPADFKKDLPEILKACIDKFGGEAGAAPPAQ
jgi:K+-sensing histidine kinase KdpD